MKIEFTFRNREGRVEIDFNRNDDPALIGYPALQLPYESQLATGFPVCRASLEFDADGYGAMFGWIQVVRCSADPHDDRDFYIVDLPPMMEGLDVPFAYFGFKPVLFDAPSTTNTHGEVKWVAHTFLTYSETAVMTRDVCALVGFSWGYQLHEGVIALVPPELLKPERWNSHLDLLGERCPGWRFKPGFAV